MLEPYVRGGLSEYNAVLGAAGIVINVADPELEADGADGVTEGQAGFSIPGGGIRVAFVG